VTAKVQKTVLVIATPPIWKSWGAATEISSMIRIIPP
jgi:hypothetical protein